MMNTEERDKKYIASRFRVGLEPYLKVLETEVWQHFPERNSIKVLDIGCGPGEWSFAMAKTNPGIKVIGIDINQYFLDFARQYANKNNIHNVTFHKISYEQLLDSFPPASFDVILCNSVLMYLDEEKALDIISRLLKDRGILFSMWNHHIGYYLRRFINSIGTLDFRQGIETIRIIVIDSIRRYIFNRPTGDNFISYGYIKGLAHKYGIKIKRMALTPRIDYPERYLIFPCIWNFKGVKIGKFH